MAEITGQEITASESNDQQLPFSEDTTWTGRLRLRHSTRHESSKRSYDSDFSSSSSIRSESTRPQMGVSRAQSSVTTRSHLETFFSGPKLTKTGRISKAKKGVKDAHICRQCGKVRVNRYCSALFSALFSPLPRTCQDKAKYPAPIQFVPSKLFVAVFKTPFILPGCANSLSQKYSRAEHMRWVALQTNA